MAQVSDLKEVEGGWTAVPDHVTQVKEITDLHEACQSDVFILLFY